MESINARAVNTEDLNKLVTVLQADGYEVNLSQNSAETYKITNSEDGSVSDFEAYTYNITKAGSQAGSLHQVINGDLVLTFATIDLADETGAQEYYALNITTGEVTKSRSQTDLNASIGAESIEDGSVEAESTYSICKTVVNVVCSRSLKVTLGACIEACLETGPGEIVCAPLCYAMQWATCKLGAANICAPFK